MSLTSKQVKELRDYAKGRKGELAKLINDAAETIELLSTKLSAANMERSSQYYHGGWIPCSERLPEDNRQVLVYAQSTHFVLAKYDEMREADGTYKKQWVTFDAWKPLYTIKNVIAWMPLPTEPWKGEEHE